MGKGARQNGPMSTSLPAATNPGAESLEVPLNTVRATGMQLTQPYARIQLSVEPDSFVLQPYQDPPTNNNLGQGQGQRHEHKELVRILFQVPSPEDYKEKSGDTSVDTEIKEDMVNPAGSGSASLPIERRNRLSFLSPETYTRSERAKDYIIYGCIGLLDLYTGPHLIVIVSVKTLGDIEDKPVFGINKVAVLPMAMAEACQILDRMAQWIDPSTGPVDHMEQDSEHSSTLQTPAQEEQQVAEEEALEQPALVVATKSPKIRFSFLGKKQDRTMQENSISGPSSPSMPTQTNNIPIISVDTSPSSAKKVSFDISRGSAGLVSSKASKESPSSQAEGPTPTSPSSPPLSPRLRPSELGFFAKLKDSVLDKKPPKVDTTSTATLPPASLSDSGSSIGAESTVRKSLQLNSTTEIRDQAGIGAEDGGRPAENNADKEHPTPISRPPSALKAAEKFVATSTKQLTSWGEEAVSGMFRSSTSPSHSRTTSTTDEQLSDSKNTVSQLDSSDEEEELEKNQALDRRIIREISSILGTGFYFSTEFNLLSSMQQRSERISSPSTDVSPLWQQVDSRFWWNEHLLKEFIDIKANGYILPVMQGYVEIEPCVIEEQHFEFTLISRRSRERSGLRYQRRGIDEGGNTANFVETEQLLRIVRNDSSHQVSFVQTRGSIPLFWSQSPYRLKPVPVLERTEHENEAGFKKHVESLLKRYGRQVFINLVEQRGLEQIAGSAYTRYVKKLAEPQIKYVEFDFHEECRGMRYENIDRLIKILETPFQELGYCWLAKKNSGQPQQDNDEAFERLYSQKGAIRTNCMDCLDRTNVVQSAIGRYILNHQLLRLGIASFPDKGLSVYEDFENTFNHVWANNGDAISREYAGTSALKGDFTRTGKRNLQGMINDATNSVARMYQNTFKDYFRQAAIDYLLGVADVDVFKNLQTTAFGTAVVPPPALPSTVLSVPELAAVAVVETSDGVSTTTTPSVILPSLLPQPSDATDSQPVEYVKIAPGSSDETILQQDPWLKIREAAIETSAEIVISPGEDQWKGWTFIGCSNEIGSSLTSASSPQPLPQQPLSSLLSSRKKSLKMSGASFVVSSPRSESQKNRNRVIYDEKVVLLTDKALYICTYDYEMEKVVEFWRLALEKMTGIDKGAFFLTAQDTSKMGQDPLENYGFAVLYRASAGGETLRVNSGSVRNRRMMATDRTPLDRVMEEDDGHSSSLQELQGSGVSSIAGVDAQDEQNAIRTVRFKVVKHPETSIVPFVTSSAVTSDQSRVNPLSYKRTAQDCVEWVVTEIVQARCELISVAEKGTKGVPETQSSQTGGYHGRSSSEEYNYQPPGDTRRPSVQVDLVIRDRVLQSLDVAAELEKETMASGKERQSTNNKLGSKNTKSRRRSNSLSVFAKFKQAVKNL
ncbi:hypothetical protein BGZ51_009522 [Haplosporangium sp. Z 767]|nr:hypothetical protein BGZ51_009522 [Haplosporangium sp. Z 767]